MTRIYETNRGGWERKNRAVLLEVNGRTGIALTDDGRFIKVKCRPGAEEGQEIFLGAPGRASGLVARPAFGPRLRPGFAMALVFALCLVVAAPFATMRVLASGEPVGYVSLDINPSLEFGVNQWGRVVSASGLNPDGEAVLESLDWQGRPLGTVAGEASLVAYGLGFLPGDEEEGEILICSCPARDGQTLSLGFLRQMERVRAEVEARVRDGLGAGAPPVTVDTVLADAARVRTEAEALGLSIGRYSVLLAAEEAGLDVSAADFQGGLGKAIRDAGGHPGDIFKAAHTWRHMSKLAEKYQERNGLGGKGSGQDGAGAGDEGNSGTGNGKGGKPGKGEPGAGAGGSGVTGGPGQIGTGSGQGDQGSGSDKGSGKRNAGGNGNGNSGANGGSGSGGGADDGKDKGGGSGGGNGDDGGDQSGGDDETGGKDKDKHSGG